MDWFLYDNGLRHERVNMDIVKSRIVFSAEVVRIANNAVFLTRHVFFPYLKLCANAP